MAYTTIKKIRDAGVSSDVEADEGKITALIALCSQFLDRATRQWFESRSLTVVVDGTDSDTLHLPVPILTVTSLKLNSDTNALSTDLYEVYNGRQLPDDRKNPRIRVGGESGYRDIYTAPMMSGRLIFRKGYRNQTISGTFGYLEEDDTIPLLIERAVTKMVVEKITSPIYTALGCTAPAPAPSPGGGVIVEESTDGHRIKYATAAAQEQRTALNGFTQDAEVHDIIKLYRAPIAIAAPVDWSYN